VVPICLIRTEVGDEGGRGSYRDFGDKDND
jgi:hypothetical protein